MFHKDLMAMAVDKFSEECSLKKRSLDKKCKLYVQNQHNSSTWTEIPTTDVFLQTVQEQISNKSRVKNNTVKIRFLFGRPEVGLKFKDNKEVHGIHAKILEMG